jgi:uncharacterized SAM-binding protein YcdF (DUF218 family)
VSEAVCAWAGIKSLVRWWPSYNYFLNILDRTNNCMDKFLFIVGKLVGVLIRPESWLIFGMGLALLALLGKRQRIACWLLGLTFAGTLLLAIFPLGDLLMRHLETRYPSNPPLHNVEGIIVLGGAEDAGKSAYWGQPQLREGAERYTVALELARRFPKARVLFTGGSGELRDLAGGGVSEGSVAQAFFLAQELDSARLLIEHVSRNTSENARNSLVLAQPKVGQTWVLVTSAFHMPRALHGFTQAGWAGLVPYPVDYRSGSFTAGIGWELAEHLKVLNTAVNEYAGLLVYGGWRGD